MEFSHTLLDAFGNGPNRPTRPQATNLAMMAVIPLVMCRYGHENLGTSGRCYLCGCKLDQPAGVTHRGDEVALGQIRAALRRCE